MIRDVNAAILPPDELRLVRENFEVMQSQSGIASLIFYRNLFTLDPSLRPLFHTSIELQGRKLMEALEFTMATLESPAGLQPVLESMGRRHVSYGTLDGHYVTMTTAMLKTLQEVVGVAFTPAAYAAWSKALGFITEAMIRGADGVRELTGSNSAGVSSAGGPS